MSQKTEQMRRKAELTNLIIDLEEYSDELPYMGLSKEVVGHAKETLEDCIERLGELSGQIYANKLDSSSPLREDPRPTAQEASERLKEAII